MLPTLDEVREKLKVWDGCALKKTATQAVLGDGPATAEIMFVGEAPGEQEDKQGRPFCGQAGKFLEELIGTIGLKRSDVYISNVVKFRPPENRDPTPEEKAQCLPWLMLEIAIIKPKVIVPLGRHALTSFFTKLSITAAHGKAQTLRQASASAPGLRADGQGDTPGLAIFPIYHPAAALHNPGLRDALYADFKGLGEFLKTGRGRE